MAASSALRETILLRRLYPDLKPHISLPTTLFHVDNQIVISIIKKVATHRHQTPPPPTPPRTEPYQFVIYTIQEQYQWHNDQTLRCSTIQITIYTYHCGTLQWTQTYVGWRGSVSGHIISRHIHSPVSFLTRRTRCHVPRFRYSRQCTIIQ